MPSKRIHAKHNGREPGEIAREMLSMPVGPDKPYAKGERGENGLIKPKDESKERLVIPCGGGSITLGKALPSRQELRDKIRGMNAKQAIATLMQADIENGDVLDIWEKKKAMAKGGDWRAIEAYLDRFIGKATQPLAVAAEVRHSLSDEDREAINGIRAIFGMAGPEVVATVEAKEVA